MPVEVVEMRGYRALYFGSQLRQSCMKVDEPERLVLPYSRGMTAPLLFLSKLERVLMVGLGGGSLARFFRYYFPQTAIDVVELSPRVVSVAREYFAVVPDDKLTIETGDGAVFLREADRGRFSGYDLILVDAFGRKGMASSVYADAFFQSAVERLAPGGIVSVNAWRGDTERWEIASRALRRAFDGRMMRMMISRETGNEVLMGLSAADSPWRDHAALERRAALLERSLKVEYHDFLLKLRKGNAPLLRRWLPWL